MTLNNVILLTIIIGSASLAAVFGLFPDIWDRVRSTMNENLALAIGIASSFIGYGVYLAHFRNQSAKNGSEGRDSSQSK